MIWTTRAPRDRSTARAAWAAIAAGVILAASPAATGDVPFVGIVIAAGTTTHSGAGRTYVTGSLTEGQLVQVEQVIQGWYKIVPPRGSYSFISKAFVDAHGDGTLGSVNQDRAAVRAPNQQVKGNSYRTQVTLPKGAEVRILGEYGSYYMIEPPAGAYVYVQAVAIRRATAQELRPPTSSPAGAAGAAAPAEQSGQTGPSDAGRAAEPGEAPAAAVDAGRPAVDAGAVQGVRSNTASELRGEIEAATAPRAPAIVPAAAPPAGPGAADGGTPTTVDTAGSGSPAVPEPAGAPGPEAAGGPPSQPQPAIDAPAAAVPAAPRPAAGVVDRAEPATPAAEPPTPPAAAEPPELPQPARPAATAPAPPAPPAAIAAPPAAVAAGPEAAPPVALQTAEHGADWLAILEQRFEHASTIPLETQPLEALLGAYRQLLERDGLDQSQRRLVERRIATLEHRARASAAIRDLQSASRDGTRRLEVARQAEAERRSAVARAAGRETVGRLLASPTYDGAKLPRLYRLVEPGSGRMIAYVLPGEALDVRRCLGRVVALQGQTRWHPDLNLPVLEPSGAELVETVRP